MIHNLSEMEDFAKAELERITELSLGTRDSHATLVLLSGELGAGKTTFVKSLGHALGVHETIPSPTFVIARFYDIPKHQEFSRLVHVDAYRIEDEEELRPIGWEKLLADPKNLIVVEWPEKIPHNTICAIRTLMFTVVDETTRTIRA